MQLHQQSWRITTFLVTLILAVGLARGEGVSVWQTLPWLAEAPHADPATRAMMPAGEALVQLADAEYETLCLAVRNDTAETLAYTVDTTALAAAAPGLTVTVRSSWVTPIALGNAERPPLKTLGADKRFPPKDVGDPLLLATPERPLYVPAGESRSLWLTLHTAATPAGVYRAPLRLLAWRDGARTTAPVATVAVTVQVWPFALPEQLDIACYHWDYGFSLAALADMRAHKVNTFMMADFPRDMVVDADGNVSGDLDLERIVGKRQAVPGATFVGSYGTFTSYLEWCKANDVAYMSPRFKEVFAASLRYMVAELKSAGLGYGDFMLQTIDEANGEKAKRVIEMGQLAREIDPQIRWALTVMASQAEVEAMAPYHACIMIRGEATWSPEQAAFYKAYQDGGGVVWQFKQTGMERGKAEVHMLNRLRQWRTWLNRWSGAATFVYTSCPYSYFGDPVPVRHWEAIREGNEDYQYFALLRDRAAATGDEASAAAMAYVDAQVTALIGPTAPGTGMIYTPEDPVMMLYPYQARQRLAARIAALGGDGGALEPLAYAPPWVHREAPASVGDGDAVVPQENAATAPSATPATDADSDASDTPTLRLLLPPPTAAREVIGAWTADEYLLRAPGALEPGREYRLSFNYEWPAEIETGSVVVAGVGTWTVARDGRHFSQTFTAPAGTVDLVLRLKEFRIHQGEQVAASTEISHFRLAAGLPDGGFAAASEGDAENTDDGDATAPTTASTTQTADTTSYALRVGERYRISLRYRSTAPVQRALNVVSVATRKARNRQVPVATPFSTSLPDSGGEWWWFTETFTVPADTAYRVDVGPRDYQPTTLETADLSLLRVNGAPLQDRLDRLHRHQATLRTLAARFPARDPLLAVSTLPLETLADADAFSAALVGRPYTAWLIDAEHPRPSSSKLAFGMAAGLSGGPAPGGEQTVLGEAVVGICNFTAEPLCFMVEAKKDLPWTFMSATGQRHRPEAFLKTYGWCELVIAPGETARLAVAKSGDLTLHPMDGRLPSLILPVILDAGADGNGAGGLGLELELLP